MKPQALFNSLPLLALAIVALTIWQQWQQQAQNTRPDYDQPAAPVQSFQLQPKPVSEQAEVISVHDGDTITVRQGYQPMRVRLCGIDAPELSQPGGDASRQHLQALLPVGQPVSLFISDTDRYGRKVAEVFVPASHGQRSEEEKFVNYEQVATGHAYVYPRYVDRCLNGLLKVSSGVKFSEEYLNSSLYVNNLLPQLSSRCNPLKTAGGKNLKHFGLQIITTLNLHFVA